MIIKLLINVMRCKHDYVKYSDFCYHDIEMNKHYVETSIQCVKCGKKKHFKYYIPESMMSN